MFPFDLATLPELTTRKALLVVDFQHDFVSPDGALPVSEPPGYVERTLQLVEAFRLAGDIVWVLSKFDAPRPQDPGRVLLPTPSNPLGCSPNNQETACADPELATGEGPSQSDAPPHPEAFLSHCEPSCLEPSTPGCKLGSSVMGRVHKSDLLLTKSHYSAFEGTQLLRLLQAKVVVDVLICGSLANVGVYATALDAAGHGMNITIVDDCCGYRCKETQALAMKNITELTGCEIASSQEIMASLSPKSSKVSSHLARPLANSCENLGSESDASTSLAKSMTGLSLDPDTLESQPPTCKSSSHEKFQKDGVGSPLTPSEPSSKPNPTRCENDICDSAERRDSITVVESGTTSTTTVKPSSADSALAETLLDGQEERIEQRGLCEGDTDIIQNLLPEPLEKGMFEQLRDEIEWKSMSHQGGDVPRLVAVQGQVYEDDSVPIYRHPSDESPPLLPFSEAVLAIKAETEKCLGHAVNHALIQYYRDGNDYISEHSDKSLDVVRDSYIANVSLGAERTMVWRTKRSSTNSTPTKADSLEGAKRRVQRARLPHNSLCRMGLKTNMAWLHAIRQDKRADRDKSSAELAFGGERISLTFRSIGTFLSKDGATIWGQGATGKTREDAQPVLNGQTPEAVEMLRAFGAENHSSSFVWDSYYGKGFDVLHIRTAPRFFASADPVINLRISLMLAERGISFSRGTFGTQQPSSAAAAATTAAGSGAADDNDDETTYLQRGEKNIGPQLVRVRFVDNDTARSSIEGELAIMLYLSSPASKDEVPLSRAELAVCYTRFQRAMHFLDRWRWWQSRQLEDGEVPDEKILQSELAPWDADLATEQTAYLAGSCPSLPDFAFWPVLHDVVEVCGPQALRGLDALAKYYETMTRKVSTQRALKMWATPHA